MERIISRHLSMQGKTVLVTGATNGIGLVTARELAHLGARTVGVGRDPEKSAAVAGRLREETGNPEVTFLVADLSRMGSVLQLADDFRTRFDRLDVLVNNAGAYFVERQVTSEGLEMTFALNHLSYFLLTDRMLELLQASGPGRIVNVSSQAHSNASLDFDDLQHERQYDGWKTYCESKLMNLYFTFELARRLKGGRVVVNALHPGLVATGFGHNNPNPPAWLQRAQRNAISPEQGAETMIYLAASPAVQGVSGQYFYQKKVAESSQTSKDGEAARRLWEISAQMVGDFR